MGTSAALNTSNQYIKYKITINQNSQNQANNTSNVTVTVNFYRTNTGYTTYGTGTVYCKINGITYSASVTSNDRITSGGINLFAKTLDIPHDTTGTKTLAVSAWISHSQFSASEQGYSQTLTPIPRGTTPTFASTVAMGGTLVISLPRASTGYTHTLSYQFGSKTETLAEGVGTEYRWAVPMSLAYQVPNAVTGIGTITCKTYSGSTLIGTKSVSFTATVPSSVVPIIDAATVGESDPAISAQFTTLVQYRSKVRVKIYASGAYGSTIKSYATVIGSVTYKDSEFESGVINSSGTLTTVVTVTDSRGRTAKWIQDRPVAAYFPPKIDRMSAWRVDAGGAAADDGATVYVSADYTTESVNGENTREYKLQYRKTSDTSFTTYASGTADLAHNGLIPVASPPDISPDFAYVIRLEVSDFFQTVSADWQIPTASPIMDFRETGKGIAFGKVSEKDAFEVNMDAEFKKQVKVYAPVSDLADGGFLRMYRKDESLAAFLATSDGGNGLNLHLYQGGAWTGVLKILPTGQLAPGAVPMTDYVVSHGTSGNWGYRKWASGFAECWMSLSLSAVAVTTALGALFRSGNVFSMGSHAYPFAFVVNPDVNAQFHTINSNGAWFWPNPDPSSANRNLYPPTGYLVRPTSLSGVDGALNYYVIGKWK